MNRRNVNTRPYGGAAAGFTLIEVLLVLLILGMLAGLAIFAASGTRESAKKKTTDLKIKALGNAVERYSMDIGHYPSEDEGGLQALTVLPSFDDQTQATKWSGPYIKGGTEAINDAWGRPLHYELVQTTAVGTAGVAAGGAPVTPYHISSDGPDGQEGTADDIKNWSDSSTTP